jgi:hypothetical protein
VVFEKLICKPVAEAKSSRIVFRLATALSVSFKRINVSSVYYSTGHGRASVRNRVGGKSLLTCLNDHFL